ncbi:MAG: hypothetical protein EP330_26000 [Deltaproteobacteria bacterium]|nr:MAG: hypothetical protein EP330_26000 [Deltaproteobacteria bacterium]
MSKLALLALATLAAAPLLGQVASNAVTADIRPEDFVGQAEDADRQARGRAIAERGVLAQGGRALWDRQQSLHLAISDDWDLTPFRMYMPLAEDQVSFEGDIDLHHDLGESSWTITSGSAAGSQFGVHNGRAWKGSQEANAGPGVQFFAPTMEFLPTLAFHVGSADVVSYVDTVQRDGEAYDRVFVTWGDPETPTATMDQYLVYYAQDTGLLTYLECTVRDFGPFVTGSVHYGAWTSDDLSLPTEYAMHLIDLAGPRVHRVTLDRVAWR